MTCVVRAVPEGWVPDKGYAIARQHFAAAAAGLQQGAWQTTPLRGVSDGRYPPTGAIVSTESAHNCLGDVAQNRPIRTRYGRTRTKQQPYRLLPRSS